MSPKLQKPFRAAPSRLSRSTSCPAQKRSRIVAASLFALGAALAGLPSCYERPCKPGTLGCGCATDLGCDKALSCVEDQCELTPSGSGGKGGAGGAAPAGSSNGGSGARAGNGNAVGDGGQTSAGNSGAGGADNAGAGGDARGSGSGGSPTEGDGSTSAGTSGGEGAGGSAGEGPNGTASGGNSGGTVSGTGGIPSSSTGGSAGGGTNGFPSACLGCAVEGCSSARGACQADATCLSCLTIDYRAASCSGNAAFGSLVRCLCLDACVPACASVCM